MTVLKRDKLCHQTIESQFYLYIYIYICPHIMVCVTLSYSFQYGERVYIQLYGLYAITGGSRVTDRAKEGNMEAFS